jgi:hypothetical protein
MRWLAAGVLFAAGMVGAQTSVPPSSSAVIQDAPQLSPQAAYDEASRPVDIVHRAVGNWSEVEQASLAVAVEKAKAACGARSPYQYTGEDLLAYARLCSFAQMWEPVQQAATGYLIAQSAATPEEKRTGFPNLSLAFDYVVQASLQLKNPVNAFGTAQTMLRTVAYDDLVSEAVNGVVRYVQLIQTNEALTLLEQRQPVLLAMLRARGATAATSAAGQGFAVADGLFPSSRPPLAVHELYADAIELPAMQQFAREPAKAAASYAALEAALPHALSADDAVLVAAVRRQYVLLGAPLPAIAASASLLDTASHKAPDLNGKKAGAAAFLLFPYWCAQCVAMNPHFNDVRVALEAEGVQFYALLAEAKPWPTATKVVIKSSARGGASALRPGKSQGAAASHEDVQPGAAPDAADQLMGTATLIVPAETVDTFAATDFPLLIATDGCGLVRYIGVAPENVLVDGGLVYQIAERVLQQWPLRTVRVGGSARVERVCGGLER